MYKYAYPWLICQRYKEFEREHLEHLWYYAILTFREPCIMIYSYTYNKSQQDALFLKFIWYGTLHVSDKSTVHHQEYLNTVYTQYLFVMLILLAVC